MQTLVTDIDFYKSAKSLSSYDLEYNLTESTHILSSLLGASYKLSFPKEDVSNNPGAVMWKGNESYLLSYILIHLEVTAKNNKEPLVKHVTGSVNGRDILILKELVSPNWQSPSWVRNKAIFSKISDQHKRNLVFEDSEFYYPKFKVAPSQFKLYFDSNKDKFFTK